MTACAAILEKAAPLLPLDDPPTKQLLGVSKNLETCLAVLTATARYCYLCAKHVHLRLRLYSIFRR